MFFKIFLIPLCFILSTPAWSLDNPAKQSNPTVHEHSSDWMPMGGLKYDSVAGVTASGSILYSIADPFGRPDENGFLPCSHTFLVNQIEVGRGGGKIQFGIGEWYMAGWAAKLSLLRTWRNSLTIDPNQTYLGVEWQLSFFLLNGSLGLYAKISGDEDRTGLITWSTGVGF